MGNRPKGWDLVCGIQWEDVDNHICTTIGRHDIHSCADDNCDITIEDRFVRKEKYVKKYRSLGD